MSKTHFFLKFTHDDVHAEQRDEVVQNIRFKTFQWSKKNSNLNHTLISIEDTSHLTFIINMPAVFIKFEFMNTLLGRDIAYRCCLMREHAWCVW